MVTGDQTAGPARLIVVTGARGGQGTTTVAAALALHAAAHGDVVLAAAPDQEAAALLGVPAIDRGEIVAVTPRLTLATSSRLSADTVVLDGGLHPGGPDREDAECYVVLRGPCYLALATVLASGGRRPVGIIVVAEEGRSLTAKDVSQVTGVPVVATVTASPRVARTIDAGLLVTRLPRLHELDDLRRLAAPRSPHRSTRSDAMTNPSKTHTDLPLWRPATTAVGASAGISMSRFARARHLSPMWDVFASQSHAEHRPAESRRGRLLHRRGRHLGRGLLHRPR